MLLKVIIFVILFSALPCFIVPIHDETGLSLREMAVNLSRIPNNNRGITHAITPTGYQIRSPSLVLYHQNGTVLELSIFLCGLLIGKGIKAYVAMGIGT